MLFNTMRSRTIVIKLKIFAIIFMTVMLLTKDSSQALNYSDIRVMFLLTHYSRYGKASARKTAGRQHIVFPFRVL